VKLSSGLASALAGVSVGALAGGWVAGSSNSRRHKRRLIVFMVLVSDNTTGYIVDLPKTQEVKL
jgi:hypothetical protein